MQNSIITLRYQNKTRQFRCNKTTNENELTKLICNCFNIKNGQTLAFADTQGQLYDINQLMNKASYMKNPLYDIMIMESTYENNNNRKEDLRLSKSGSTRIKKSTNKPISMIIIRNVEEFEKMIWLQQGINQISLLFVIDSRDQIEDIHTNYNEILLPYQNKYDIYCYLKNDDINEDKFDLIMNDFPILVIYNGNQKILELPINFKKDDCVLENLLDKLNKNINKGSAGSLLPNSLIVNTNDKLALDTYTNNTNVIKTKEQILDDLLNNNQLNERDYYYLKYCLANNNSELEMIFTTYKRTNNYEDLKKRLNDYLNNPNKRANKPLDEIKERPQTSYGVIRSYDRLGDSSKPSSALPNMIRKTSNRISSSTQEKFIQIIGELENKNYINEQYASIIKSLILEENVEIIKALNDYLNDYYDDIILSNILIKLSYKLKHNYLIRPKSPYPKKDELIKLVNNIVRKRLRDDNDLLLLNKLIIEEDELVYSTFDVFESDRDEEDLLDTLIKIVQKYKRIGKFCNNGTNNMNSSGGNARTASEPVVTSSYNTKKMMLSHNDKDYIKNITNGNIEESKSNSHMNVLSTKKSIDMDQTFAGPIQLLGENKPSMSSVATPLLVDNKTLGLIKQNLKQLDDMKDLKSDEYGMIFWLIDNDSQLIIDIINDHDGIQNLKKAVKSLALLAISKLNKKLRENFNEQERKFINENKEIKTSSVNTAYHCFKYDLDMDNLITTLKEIVNNRSSNNKNNVNNTNFENENVNTNASSGVASVIAKKKKFATDFMGSKSLIETVDELNLALSNSEPANEINKLQNNQFTFNKIEQENAQTMASPIKANIKDDQTNPEMKSPGRKYHALLSSNKRSDNFKGQFQLKLMSGDDPGLITPGRDDMNIDGNSNGELLQQPSQPINVIMPPKNDLNPFAQDLVDKFYENQDHTYLHSTIFKKMISEAKFLTPDNIKSLEYLMENNHPSLLEAIFTYEINQNIKDVENQLKELSNQDVTNVSFSSSPREKKRMMIFHSFRSLLHTLKSTKQISDKHYKTFLYLYMEEQVSVLACYEVYMLTGDLKELLDTLFIIEKVEFFKNESKFFSDIECFSDVIEQQLKIIYSFKKYLSLSTRVTLEKIIRTGNTSVLKIYNEFKQKQGKEFDSTFKYKNEIIHKLVSFAEENSDIIKEYERIIYENRVNNDGRNNKRKEIVEGFEDTKLIKDIAHMDLVYELIDSDHELIHSIFEVYEFTKDKMDFIENLKIVYDFIYRQKILTMLKKDPSKYTEEELKIFEDLLIKKTANLLAAYELYLATKDESEFFETADIILKKTKKSMK